jgi:hypothetical protein
MHPAFAGPGQSPAAPAPRRVELGGNSERGHRLVLAHQALLPKEAGRRSPSRSLPGAAIVTAPVARVYHQIVIPMTAAMATLTAAARPAAPLQGLSAVSCPRWSLEETLPIRTQCIHMIAIRNQGWVPQSRTRQDTSRLAGTRRGAESHRPVGDRPARGASGRRDLRVAAEVGPHQRRPAARRVGRLPRSLRRTGRRPAPCI